MFHRYQKALGSAKRLLREIVPETFKSEQFALPFGERAHQLVGTLSEFALKQLFGFSFAVRNRVTQNIGGTLVKFGMQAAHNLIRFALPGCHINAVAMDPFAERAFIINTRPVRINFAGP